MTETLNNPKDIVHFKRLSSTNDQLPIVEAPTSSTQARGSWGNKVEFVLTCIGFAVGLGNVWRFPYLVYKNGGGAFLIPYLFMLVICGIPLFFLEIALGQFSSMGPLTVWKIAPIFKGLGLTMMISTSYILIYYQVIISWSIYYFFASMSLQLPWSTCDNWWNTASCVERIGLGNSSLEMNSTSVSAAEEYFYRRVLQLTDGIDNSGSVQWHLAICLFASWCIVFLVLLKGVSSLGKASYFVSLFPYVLLTVMLIRGSTLQGALKGIFYYIRPDFSLLTNARVWGDAATQVFYSMSLSQGGLIAMASFNDFHNNVLRDAFIIPLADAFTSIYSGFVIFSVLGYMADLRNVTVAEVATQGPGLVFVVYPEGLATMPVAPLWSILFFFMMCTLGFSTQFSCSEGLCSTIMDEFPHIFRKGRRPTMLRAALCLCCFLLALPMVTQGGFYLFALVDEYSVGFPLLFIGIMEFIIIGHVYGADNFFEDIFLMVGKKPSVFWKICWCGLTPIILTGTLIFKVSQFEPMRYGHYHYPHWANTLGWLMVAFPISLCIAGICYKLAKEGVLVIIRRSAKPAADWGPALPEHRLGRYIEQDALRRAGLNLTLINEPNKPLPAYNGGHNEHVNSAFVISGDDTVLRMRSLTSSQNGIVSDDNRQLKEQHGCEIKSSVL